MTVTVSLTETGRNILNATFSVVVTVSETETVYVFLSNRTFPAVVENKLVKGKIREQIQEVIYDAIIK